MTDKIGVDDLKEGDVLLYRGTAALSKAIQFFDGSPVNHVAVYLGNGLVGEAVAEGLVQRDVSTSISGYEWVKAYRLADVPQDMGPVLDRALFYLDQGNRYGFEQLLILAILCTTRKLKITPVLRRLLRALLDAAAAQLTRMLNAGKEPMICSEFAYRVYDEADPALQDAYSIVIPGMLPLSPEEELAGPAAEVQPPGVHPDSLAALFATPASSVWIEGPGAALELGDIEEALDAEASLDELIGAYLDEVETGETSHLVEEVPLEKLRAATDRFAISLYRTAGDDEEPLAGGEIEARSAAYEHLFRAAADFVTPADLYTTKSLVLVGTVD